MPDSDDKPYTGEEDDQERRDTLESTLLVMERIKAQVAAFQTEDAPADWRRLDGLSKPLDYPRLDLAAALVLIQAAEGRRTLSWGRLAAETAALLRDPKPSQAALRTCVQRLELRLLAFSAGREAPAPPLSALLEPRKQKRIGELAETAKAHWSASLPPAKAAERQAELDRAPARAVARLQNEVFAFSAWPDVLDWFGLDPDDPGARLSSGSSPRGGRAAKAVLAAAGVAGLCGGAYAAWVAAPAGWFDVSSPREGGRIAVASMETSPSRPPLEVEPEALQMGSDAPERPPLDSGPAGAGGASGEPVVSSSEAARDLDDTSDQDEAAARQAAILALQTLLAEQELYAGEIDGLQGPETQQALRVLGRDLDVRAPRLDTASAAALQTLAEQLTREIEFRSAQDEAAWRIAQASRTVGAYAGYLRQFPFGAYADAAKREIDGLIPGAAGTSSIQSGGAQTVAVASRTVSSAAAPSLPDARNATAAVRAPVIAVDPARLPDFALFRECDLCPEMVVLPAGLYTMGSPGGEAGRWPDEGPQQSIRVGRLAVARFETTRDEWWACFQSGACSREPGLSGAREPAVNVSWADIEAYAQFVNGRSSGGYRRPTEAEWEYAARGGASGTFASAEAPEAACSLANGADAAARIRNPSWSVLPCSDGFAEVAPAGSLRANGFGLYDMLGNVWEWVEDCYRDSLANQAADGGAYAQEVCFYRVQRGGSWVDSPRNLRVAVRDRNSPAHRSPQLGFRLAKSL